MNEHQKKSKERGEVMIAYAEGKPIQYWSKLQQGWHDAPAPSWDWSHAQFRVKPEEKFVLVYRAKGTKDAWTVRNDTGTKDALEKRWKEDVARYGRLDEYEYTLVQIPEA